MFGWREREGKWRKKGRRKKRWETKFLFFFFSGEAKNQRKGKWEERENGGVGGMGMRENEWSGWERKEEVGETREKIKKKINNIYIIIIK